MSQSMVVSITTKHRRLIALCWKFSKECWYLFWGDNVESLWWAWSWSKWSQRPLSTFTFYNPMLRSVNIFCSNEFHWFIIQCMDKYFLLSVLNCLQISFIGTILVLVFWQRRKTPAQTRFAKPIFAFVFVLFFRQVEQE